MCSSHLENNKIQHLISQFVYSGLLYIDKELRLQLFIRLLELGLKWCFNFYTFLQTEIQFTQSVPQLLKDNLWREDAKGWLVIIRRISVGLIVTSGYVHVMCFKGERFRGDTQAECMLG